MGFHLAAYTNNIPTKWFGYQQILLDTTGQQKTRFLLLERVFWTLSDFAEL
jgi:hypothetical protein